MREIPYQSSSENVLLLLGSFAMAFLLYVKINVEFHCSWLWLDKFLVLSVISIPRLSTQRSFALNLIELNPVKKGS